MKVDDILQLIASTLNVAPARVSLESKAGDFEEWDSIGALSLMATLDRHGIHFDGDNVERLQSVRGIVDAFQDASQLDGSLSTDN